MNILHVSHTDLQGGRFTGYYMQQALNKSHSVESAVWNRTTDNPNVHSMRPRNFYFRYPVALARKLDDKLGLEGLTGLEGWVLPFQDYFQRADVVNLHLIHNGAFFSILSLPMLSQKKPIVWSIHDPWAMTGGCLGPFDCDRWLTGCAPRCPYPRHKSLFQYQIPAFHWQIKQRVYRKSNLQIIVASKWMQENTQKSPLLCNFPCHLIPYGIDLEKFKPNPKVESRKKFGIPSDHKVMVFRDNGYYSDRFKGMKWLMEALQIYEPKEPTSLLILEDGSAFRSLAPKYNIVTPGWIDGEELADALSAGDVFLMPSVQESFGLMAVEAMACGTPVIVCEGTALPNVIQAPKGGLAVRARDGAAIAKAIQRLLHDKDLNETMGRQGRQIAESEYSLSLNAQRHIQVYIEAIDHFVKPQG